MGQAFLPVMARRIPLYSAGEKSHCDCRGCRRGSSAAARPLSTVGLAASGQAGMPAPPEPQQYVILSAAKDLRSLTAVVADLRSFAALRMTISVMPCFSIHLSVDHLVPVPPIAIARTRDRGHRDSGLRNQI